jgi:hypothetical protein
MATAEMDKPCCAEWIEAGGLISFRLAQSPQADCAGRFFAQ